ncbi:MAG: DUF1127 domain-containing protein [Rhodovibrionaceae bacterium]
MLKTSAVQLWKLSGRSRRNRGLAAVIAVVLVWLQRAESRRALRSLDARLLRDIGLERQDALNEARKRFWQL